MWIWKSESLTIKQRSRIIPSTLNMDKNIIKMETLAQLQLISINHQYKYEFSLQDKPGFNKIKAANTQQWKVKEKNKYEFKWILLNKRATHAITKTIWETKKACRENKSYAGWHNWVQKISCFENGVEPKENKDQKPKKQRRKTRRKDAKTPLTLG